MFTKRIETIDFRTFMRGDSPKPTRKVDKLASVGFATHAVMIPANVLAASSSSSFLRVLTATMNVVDWLVVGVIIFAGVTWMFGHRTKALELLIGGSAGYILARHALDIRDFLKTI